ncbi:MAG: hypothetical protein CVV63_00670 [Tenericutes bacterium HGW-Tenericutes-8]|nr:MAG: hypothetical protein CVV63_00670 [Tenericutes bacterium HGW-Tenericutes-8]
MKKGLTLFAFLFTLIILAGCTTKSAVKVEIETITPARTSVYFELKVTDPDEEIAENGLTAVLYYEGNELTRKAPVTKDGVTSVQFDGLSVGYKYEFTVFATYGGKSHKMATGNATTTLVGGTEDNPRLIQTVEDFNNIKNDLSAFYRLEADLDFQNADFQNTYGTNAFQGKFDGNGHTIKNINMNLITSYIGLFGYNKGTIKNLTIENVNLAFTTPTQNVGIVAGKNAGLIDNVTLKDSSVSLTYARTGEIYVGGLVGLSETSSKITNSTVENVDLDLTITGRTEPYVGLVAGRTQGAQLDQVTSTGSIDLSSQDTTFVGGLVGSMENVGTIPSNLSNAQATTSIEVSIDVLTTLTNDPAMSVYVGGLLGASLGTTVTAVYADAQINLTKVSNTSTNNRMDDELSVGGIVGITTSSVTEALATGSITVGSPSSEAFTSFEEVFVGGIAGFQLGDRVKQSLAYDMVISVDTETNKTLNVSNGLGNTVSATANYFGGSLTVNGTSYQSHLNLTLLDAVETPVETTYDALLVASLEGYFTNTVIQGLLDTLKV